VLSKYTDSRIPILEVITMNIFATDNDPTVSAVNLDDSRCNKMIIESASLLANAISHYGGSASDLPISKGSGQPFKTKAWQNHPACLWVKESQANYQWLYDHMAAMISELQYRKGTIHSMSSNLQIIQNGIKFVPPGPLTPFANCTPYKQISDPIEAYQITMAYKWEHDGKEPKWTKRGAPIWYTSQLVDKARSTEGEFPWTGLRQSRSKRTTGWLTTNI
jgi:hypothetical protein